MSHAATSSPNRLRAARLAAGLSLCALCATSGVPFQQIHHIEHGMAATERELACSRSPWVFPWRVFTSTAMNSHALASPWLTLKDMGWYAQPSGRGLFRRRFEQPDHQRTKRLLCQPNRLPAAGVRTP